MSKKKYLYILAIFLASIATEAIAQKTLPPVVSTAPKVGGGTVLCRGSDCAGVLAALYWDEKGSDLQQVMDPLFEIEIDPGKMCARLKARRPVNCNLSSPPSTPGLDPKWSPNGCGTGPLSNSFAGVGLAALYPSHYSGDMNAPLRDGARNVSFLAACNSHDRCWGEGHDRTWCDQAFLSSMQDQCNSVSSTSNWGICASMASAYHTAVSNSQVTPHYDATAANRRCALWASDMKENGCRR